MFTRLPIITIACCTSFASAVPTSKVSLKGINAFSVRLLDNIASEQDDNFVVSTISVWNLLALLAEGASGLTFDELMLQLNLPKSPKLTKELYASANDILSTNHSGVILQRLGSIYVDQMLGLHKDFADLATETYNANVREVDTKDLQNVADWINYDVCVATEGRIKETVKRDSLEDLKMILIDAIYFKAQWTTAFDVQNTREEHFYDDRGRKVGKVNMMYQKAKNSVAYIDDISSQALELTYGTDQRFSMIILLPFDGISLKRLIKNLSTYPVTSIFDKLKYSPDPSDADCYVPRFKISTDLDLKQPLKYMGLNEIFEAERASFPGISDSPLFVSKASQKAELDVNEEGTSAAAATVVGLEDRILGARVEVNKPFVYMITERKSNLVLFSGVYSNPYLV